MTSSSIHLQISLCADGVKQSRWSSLREVWYCTGTRWVRWHTNTCGHSGQDDHIRDLSGGYRNICSGSHLFASMEMLVGDIKYKEDTYSPCICIMLEGIDNAILIGIEMWSVALSWEIECIPLVGTLTFWYATEELIIKLVSYLNKKECLLQHPIVQAY